MIGIHTLKVIVLAIILYTLLIYFVVSDIYIEKKNKKIFLLAILFCMINLLVDFLELWADTIPARMLIRVTSSYIGYSIRPCILLCFLKLSFPKRVPYLAIIATVFNSLLYITSPFTHLATYFSEGVRFHRGPLGHTVYLLCGILLIDITVNSIIKYCHNRTRRWMLITISCLLIIDAVFADYNYLYPNTISSLNEALVLALFLYYLFYHLHLAEQYDEKLLQNQQLQLMISQIKPHFFFNTITTIQALCSIDPKKASKTLGLFATYIRQNLSNGSSTMIPFSKELQHVKAYSEIEMLRFPNIEVQYDLAFTDFDITALSIQPLVENAIKYGIRSREHGVVLIQTQKEEDAIIITIKDNGIGFDPETLDTLDASHVGIRNVRSRMNMLQNAEMDIHSDENGTTITITIPWEN